MTFSVDVIVSIILIFYGARGWSKGLFRTLLGPISLILCVIFSAIYLKINHNILMATGILFFGPIVLNILLSFFLRIWHKKMSGKMPLGILSKFCGLLISLSWGTGMVILAILFTMLLPLKAPRIKKIQTNIRQSYSYSLIQRYIKKYVPFLKEVEKTLDVSHDSEKMKKYQGTPEVISIQENEKIQQLLNDPEIRRQMEEKDLINLLSNKKVLAVLKDEKLMKEFMRLYSRIQKDDYSNDRPLLKHEEEISDRSLLDEE